MRIAKKVHSHDSGEWLLCCWDDCEKSGVEMHKCIMEGIAYVFCSEKHRQYFLHSHIRFGRLPPGYRLTVQ